MMQIFERRYFNLNRIFLMIIGYWPYETKTRVPMRSFFMIATLIQCIPLLLSAILHHDDADRLMLNILGLLIGISSCLKMLALLIGEKKMKALCESIAENWSVIQDENEKEILYKYSETGRKLTIIYATLYISTGVIMSLSPFIPKVLDLINPLSKPRANLYLLGSEFLIDRDKYVIALGFSDAFSTLIIIAVVIGVDSMYIASSQHCCALYAIVRYRLLKLRPTERSTSSSDENDDPFDCMIKLIEFHKKALDFTTTLDDTFCLTFLLLLTIYFFMIPLLACSILANYNYPLAVYPYVVFFISLATNLFVLCWPGQIILDHGNDLFNDSCNNEWYTTSQRTQKLLLTFMQRCSRPIILTAGRVMMINFETFSTIMRTAISYIMVLASFR